MKIFRKWKYPCEMTQEELKEYNKGRIIREAERQIEEEDFRKEVDKMKVILRAELEKVKK